MNKSPVHRNGYRLYTMAGLLTYLLFPTHLFAETGMGEDADPFYVALASAAGQSPSWNFHKYLLDRDGRLVGSYSSFVKPQSEKLTKAIQKLL